MKGVPFPDGTEIGGLTILGHRGGRLSEVTYRVLYTCCVSESKVSHHTIVDREWRGRTRCPECVKAERNLERRKAWAKRIKEVARRANVELLEEPPLEGELGKISMLAKMLCCGREKPISVSAIENRARDGKTLCGSCVQIGGRPKADAGDGMGSCLGPLWARPPWVPGGQWCWGMR